MTYCDNYYKLKNGMKRWLEQNEPEKDDGGKLLDKTQNH